MEKYLINKEINLKKKGSITVFDDITEGGSSHEGMKRNRCSDYGSCTCHKTKDYE